MSQMLSPHFSLEELVCSREAVLHGIDNTPAPAIVEQLQRTAAGLEKVRAILGAPMLVSSGYRCPALNARVGGAANSQHMLGQAADFICPAFGSPLAIVTLLADSGIPFDQLIQEGTWVHISFFDTPRGEVLTAHFAGDGSPATYTHGLD